MASILPSSIPNLWPEEVAVTQVLSPLVILRHQAGQLREMTRNVLEAEVETVIAGDVDLHSFVVVVPALDRFRKVLLEVRHATSQVYPATVIMESLENFGEYPEAYGQDEFVKLLGTALSSRETKTVIHSLIAKALEVESRPPTGDDD